MDLADWVHWENITCFGLNFGRWRRTARSKSRMETFTAEFVVCSEITEQITEQANMDGYITVHTAEITAYYRLYSPEVHSWLY